VASHRLAVRDGSRRASGTASLASEPLAIDQVHAGELRPNTGAAESCQGLSVETIGAIALAEQSPYDANPQCPLSGRHPRPFGEPLERGLDD
jgi:hypothetical protein